MKSFWVTVKHSILENPRDLILRFVCDQQHQVDGIPCREMLTPVVLGNLLIGPIMGRAQVTCGNVCEERWDQADVQVLAVLPFNQSRLGDDVESPEGVFGHGALRRVEMLHNAFIREDLALQRFIEVKGIGWREMLCDRDNGGFRGGRRIGSCRRGGPTRGGQSDALHSPPIAFG